MSRPIRLTRRGWIVAIIAGLIVTVGPNLALSGKCWNHSGIGYTTCEWAKEKK